jgi:hypothetical protein
MIAEANIRLLNEQPIVEGLNISDNQNFLKKIDIYNKKQNGK